jgi:hypothetical protein
MTSGRVCRASLHTSTWRQQDARSNKRMQLTKLRAAPVLQAEVPPCAPAGRMDGGTASQLIRGVRRLIRKRARIAVVWRATARVVILTGVVVPLAGCDELLALFEPPPAPGPQFVLLLPEEKLGWTCVDFGVDGALPLVREGEAWVVDATAESIVRTSSRPEGLLTMFPRDAYRLVNGERASLPPGVQMRRATSNLDSNKTMSRHCVFYGTEQSAEKAGDAPELVWPEDSTCPAESSESKAQ